MESNGPDTSPVSAAERLRQHDQVRDRTQQHGIPRAFAHLGLGIAIAAAVYLAIMLFSFSTFDARASGGSTYVQTMVVPVLLSAPLLNGAAQRFSIRIRATPRLWITATVILAGVLTLSSLGIYGVRYPWWLNVVVAAGLFLALAAGPIRHLRSPAQAAAPERWVNQPLSTPARRMTVLVGAALGLIVATSPQDWFPLVSLAVMFAFFALMLGWKAPWGVPRTGYEWGPLHWWAFALSMAATFAVTILLARTDSVTTTAAITAGGVVLAVMAGAALLPRRAMSR